MFRKTLRAASAAADADAHYFFSLAFPPNGKLSSLFNSNSRSLFGYAKKPLYVPSIADSMERLRKFIKTDCKSGDVSADEAYRVFDSMVRMEPNFALFSYNLLLEGLAKNKRFCDVLSLYGKMDSALMTPNYFTLDILLKCFCDANRTSDAFLVLGRMFRHDYSPTIFTFNSLIQGLCIGNRVYDAVKLFLKLEKFGCHPNEITYIILCRGLGMISGNDIYRGRCRPNVVTYSCDNNNDSLCKEWNEDKAMELSDIDYPMVDSKDYWAPNSPASPWLMLACNLLVYRVVKCQEKLKKNIHSKNTGLDWKTLYDQLNRRLEEALKDQLKREVTEDFLGPRIFKGVCSPSSNIVIG